MEQGALDATCEELQGVADELAALAAEEEDRAPDGDSARRILALRERICSYTPVGTTVAVVIHSPAKRPPRTRWSSKTRTYMMATRPGRCL